VTLLAIKTYRRTLLRLLTCSNESTPQISNTKIKVVPQFQTFPMNSRMQTIG